MALPRWGGFFEKLEAEGGYMTKEEETKIRQDMLREREELRNPENMQGAQLGDATVTNVTHVADVTPDEREQLLQLNQ